jgi:hypothetical protein
MYIWRCTFHLNSITARHSSTNGKDFSFTLKLLLNHMLLYIFKLKINSTIFQVESMTAVIKSLEEKHRRLEENNSALSKERVFKQNQVNKLQDLLSCKIVEHELHVTSFQDQIEYLFEKNSGQLSEIEHLARKLNDSERAHQLLIYQKQDLLAEKDNLFSQVLYILPSFYHIFRKDEFSSI